jgi:glycosidase
VTRFFLILLALVVFAIPAQAQQMDISFRYVPSGVVENAFVPGSFNSWGQPYATGSCIGSGHEAQMSFVRFENYWVKTVSLNVGERYTYKIQVHRNVSGTSCDWLSDPLNPEVTGNNSDSVLDVTDPMTFQPAEELSADGLVRYFSVGLFSTQDIADIAFTINGVTRTDGLDFYDSATGVFRFELDRDVRSGAQFRIDATDAGARTLSVEIGELQPPVEWLDTDYSTVGDSARLRGVITRLDGTIDASLTEATLLREGGASETVVVDNGEVNHEAALEIGANTFRLEADLDGQVFTGDPFTVTRRLAPREAYAVTPTVRGSGFNIILDLQGTANLPADYQVDWALDDVLSTTTATGISGQGLSLTATADGPGELYFDVDVTAAGELIDQLRIAALVADDGTVRGMDYADTAEWTKRAVVYEIFPLQYGPTAVGAVSAPGGRLRQITEEMDYIADMGFNTIWFMPIMRNRNGMTALGAGYNIIDFKRIDERLGSADDFRALVDRAHELGIRVVLDITQSHVSPDHPWVASLKEGGPFSDYIQTTPSAHNRGQDGRGANLSEIWQQFNGENLYRKYDGFGDLANLNWDNDDLQAEMLDVFAYWLNEFDIDGFRMDVWWGPIRRYGVERFATPTREVIKRQRPDAWILGEIVGTGGGTEVYYADTDRGTALAGGLDSAYDWGLFHDALRGTYGDVTDYHDKLRNGDFWPGPNARYFRFLENHDETRMAKYRTPEQQRPLSAMLLTSTGVPMVYAGQEVGYGSGSGDTRRLPVDWNTPDNAPLATHYQAFAQARQQFPAFWTQDLQSLFVGRPFAGSPRVYAYARPFLDQNAVVAINFESTSSTITFDPSAAVEMSTDGPIPYYDIFADTSAAYLGEFEITLPPYGATVFITSDSPGFDLPALPSLPYGAVYTGVEGAASELPTKIALNPAWPNPFNPATRISYEISHSGPVRLEVFDMLGRRVSVLAEGLQTAGRHEVSFDAAALPSGTYLYRLSASGQSFTRTMVLIK